MIARFLPYAIRWMRSKRRVRRRASISVGDAEAVYRARDANRVVWHWSAAAEVGSQPRDSVEVGLSDGRVLYLLHWGPILETN